MTPEETDPLAELGAWIEEAREAGLPQPASVAFVTVGDGGRPSARTVTLKRLEDDALVFTSALWTRKAREIEANPNVALLFHWPSLGRQAHVAGQAALAERALAEELFDRRDPLHRLQAALALTACP
jgi:pyridoxamine 5'-phosphate oxidase